MGFYFRQGNLLLQCLICPYRRPRSLGWLRVVMLLVSVACPDTLEVSLDVIHGPPPPHVGVARCDCARHRNGDGGYPPWRTAQTQMKPI